MVLLAIEGDGLESDQIRARLRTTLMPIEAHPGHCPSCHVEIDETSQRLGSVVCQDCRARSGVHR